jgi:hypothetical protein
MWGQHAGIGDRVQFTAKDGGGSLRRDEHLRESTTHEEALAELPRWLANQFRETG